MNSIALFEFTSVPSGILAGDKLVKTSPVTGIYGGTVHGGKFLMLVCGTEAEIDEAKNAVEDSEVTAHSLILHNIADSVLRALLGQTEKGLKEAIMVLQASNLSTVVKAIDHAIKNTDAHLDSLRLGDGLGGQGVAILSGLLWQVEEAMEVCQSVFADLNQKADIQLIPQLHEDMRACLMRSDEFSQQLKSLLTNSCYTSFQQQRPSVY